MPFHYTAALEEVLWDLARHVPELAHLDPARIFVSLAEARQRTRHGIYAKVLPSRGDWAMPPTPGRAGPGTDTLLVPHGASAEFSYQGRRGLYLMYFYLPRFHDQSFQGKVSTVIHECYHISPGFDGRLRRLEGGRAHGRSLKAYERTMDAMAARYLEIRGDWPALEFLKLSTEELIRTRGTLFGLRIQEPGSWPPEPSDCDGPRGFRGV
ncbi:MAG: hypothetical protein HY303_01870 [Candidatus Wallbacteria bacterium]|nr:hypothetical protein [Candidatus Wallbacteria bacterium]